jgi:hypothetical protein
MSSPSVPWGPVPPSATPLPGNGPLLTLPDPQNKFRISVDYPANLKPGVIDTVRVDLAPFDPASLIVDLGRPLLPEPLPVRLVIPGAIVSPSEQGLEASPFAPMSATFHVVALAAGPLPQARVEVMRNGKVEGIELEMNARGNGAVRVMFWLALLLPLLLHAAARWPEWVSSIGPEREALVWLPGLPGRAQVAAGVQNTMALLTLVAREGHLSFFSLAVFATGAIGLYLVRRPRRSVRHGETFHLGAPPRAAGPPSYLTPVTVPEIAHT